jgi:diguanylate cyclase (GGDEF)-like protein
MSELPDEIMRRLRTCTTFPTPPPVAMQVVQLAQDPDIDLARVADVVSLDPAIAAKVMRIANSAMYARRRQTSNLRQALIMLGLNATLTLALSFTMVSTLKRNPPKGFDFDAYWRRTILSATWGKLLATESGRRDAEEVFLASLLQDIGMLVIDKIWPEVYADITPFRMDHEKTCEHERAAIGVDHPMIGAALLGIWNMPPGLSLAVRHSHDPGAAGIDGEQRGFVQAVALAGELGEIWGGRSSELAMRRVGNLAHKYFGILPNRLVEMFETVREQLPVAEGIFDMQVFDGDRLQEITESAREILMVRNLHAIARLEDEKDALQNQKQELQQETSRDSLTNVYNRRHFETLLSQEFATATRHAFPLSVIFVDVDYFKQVNDSRGHQAGDEVLVAVARLLTRSLRDSDSVARYGGDEFVLLLPGTDTAQAEKVAGRIAKSAPGNATGFSNERPENFTLSLGVATFNSQVRFANEKELLAAADAALYHAKREGRNRHSSYEAIKAA